MGAALGLGILAKGPVALLAPLLTAVFAPWWGGRRPGWRWWAGLLAAVAVAAAVALSWALPAARAGGPAYANAILFSQTGERVVHSFAHGRPWWWYWRRCRSCSTPTRSGRLSGGAWASWRPARRRPRDALLPGLDPAGPGGLLGDQRQAAPLPAPPFPAFALLAARLLDGAAPPRRWSALPAAAVPLLVGAVLAAAPLLAHRPDIPGWAGQVWPSRACCWPWRPSPASRFTGRRLPGRPAAPTLLTLLLLTALYAGFSAPLRQAYDLRPVARHLAAAEREGRPIAYAGDYHGQLHFLGRLVRPFEVDHPRLAESGSGSRPSTPGGR